MFLKFLRAGIWEFGDEANSKSVKGPRVVRGSHSDGQKLEKLLQHQIGSGFKWGGKQKGDTSREMGIRCGARVHGRLPTPTFEKPDLKSFLDFRKKLPRESRLPRLPNFSLGPNALQNFKSSLNFSVNRLCVVMGAPRSEKSSLWRMGLCFVSDQQKIF